MLPSELSAVEKLLSEAWDQEVRLREVEELREGRCFRIGCGGSPDSVVVKLVRHDPKNPTTPQSFFDEYAALAFMNETAPPGLAPRLYAGDVGQRIMVFEDFGRGATVATALQGPDPEIAREALALHAEAVADLHASSLGKEFRYREIRSELGPTVENRGGMGWGDLRRLRPDVEQIFEFTGQTVTAKFWDEYDELIGAIENPAPYRAFVHNDSCPDNTVLENGRVRLIDFEVCGFHTGLLDAVYCRLSMPHCWLSQRLPGDVAPYVERRYRERIAPALSEPLDDTLFGRRVTEACAYWLISNRTWLVHTNKEDFNWGAASWRQRVVLRLEQFVKTTEEFSHLTEMGRAAQGTLDHLRRIWNVEPMPLYVPFRKSA